MSLTTSISRNSEGLVTITLAGRLDTVTYGDLEKALTPLLAGDARVMTFDLGKLTFISSMGLRVLLKVRAALESKKRTLLMVNVPPPIAKVFEIANALPQECVFASVEEADRYLAVMQQKELEKQRSTI